MTILGFILFLIVAAVCAIIAAALVPGRMPGGYGAATVCGVVGAWLGANLVGQFGPSLAGVSLLPTVLGAAILVFTIAMFSGESRVKP